MPVFTTVMSLFKTETSLFTAVMSLVNAATLAFVALSCLATARRAKPRTAPSLFEVMVETAPWRPQGL